MSDCLIQTGNVGHEKTKVYNVFVLTFLNTSFFDRSYPICLTFFVITVY